MMQPIPQPYLPDQHLPALSRLLTIVENHDNNGEDPSEAALRDMVSWPNFEPEKDCWVIPNPDKSDELIGYGSTYAQTAVRCYGFVAVDPEWRQQGFGTTLLNRVMDRTDQRGVKQLAIDANHSNLAANAFLKKFCFDAVGDSWIMRRPAGLPAPSAEWPAGFSIRRYPTFNDPQLLADALNAFIDMWGHGQNEKPTTAETAENVFLKYYNPEGVFVTFAPDGSAAGYVSIQFNEKEDDQGRLVDVLDGPGVVPPHRHLNLHRPLVSAALEYQQANSENSVELQSWGDLPETTAIYNSLGFETTAHFISYLREIN